MPPVESPLFLVRIAGTGPEGISARPSFTNQSLRWKLHDMTLISMHENRWTIFLILSKCWLNRYLRMPRGWHAASGNLKFKGEQWIPTNGSLWGFHYGVSSTMPLMRV